MNPLGRIRSLAKHITTWAPAAAPAAPAAAPCKADRDRLQELDIKWNWQGPRADPHAPSYLKTARTATRRRVAKCPCAACREQLTQSRLTDRRVISHRHRLRKAGHLPPPAVPAPRIVGA